MCKRLSSIKPAPPPPIFFKLALGWRVIANHRRGIANRQWLLANPWLFQILVH